MDQAEAVSEEETEEEVSEEEVSIRSPTFHSPPGRRIDRSVVLQNSPPTSTASPTPLQVLDCPIGGRLQNFWKTWEIMGVEPSIVNIVREGYKLVLDEKPPLSRTHRNIQLPGLPSKRASLLKIVQELLTEQVIEIVQDIHSPGYYNHFFITPKSTPGKWRPILDLKIFNFYMVKEKFKMETAESIRQALQPGDWATSLDFTSAYHHIPIHKSSRKYLRFAINNVVYQYKALPMGLTSSARIFTKIIKVIQGMAQKKQVHLHQYLDDWLIRAKSQELSRIHTGRVQELAMALGFKLNLDKSELTPTQEIIFLGYNFWLKRGLVAPSEARWEKIKETILPFMQYSELPAWNWQSLIGLLASTEKLVHQGLLHLRPLQLALIEAWSPIVQTQDIPIQITPAIRQELVWWQKRENVMLGVPLARAPAQHISLRTLPPRAGEDIWTSWKCTGFGMHGRNPYTSMYRRC